MEAAKDVISRVWVLGTKHFLAQRVLTADAPRRSVPAKAQHLHRGQGDDGRRRGRERDDGGHLHSLPGLRHRLCRHNLPRLRRGLQGEQKAAAAQRGLAQLRAHPRDRHDLAASTTTRSSTSRTAPTSCASSTPTSSRVSPTAASTAATRSTTTPAGVAAADAIFSNDHPASIQPPSSLLKMSRFVSQGPRRAERHGRLRRVLEQDDHDVRVRGQPGLRLPGGRQGPLELLNIGGLPLPRGDRGGGVQERRARTARRRAHA